MDVEVALGGRGDGDGGVDTGVAGGDGFGTQIYGLLEQDARSRRDYNRGLFRRRLNFIMFLLLPLRLIICV